MDSRDAIAAAKQYLTEIYADEQIGYITLEEIEHRAQDGVWVVALQFSRPWTTPRTRAQEVLENLGAVSPQRRSSKLITMTEAGDVLSMKSPVRVDTAA